MTTHVSRERREAVAEIIAKADGCTSDYGALADAALAAADAAAAPAVGVTEWQVILRAFRDVYNREAAIFGIPTTSQMSQDEAACQALALFETVALLTAQPEPGAEGAE